ncbi:MAG: DNA polymerase II large subunit [Candidatus Heimdallarchaeota archaeon]|nr:DNA polymerase II large subunit [Candidatus Heimdallarchaeota archaeon]
MVDQITQNNNLSISIQSYFDSLNKQLKKIYNIATKARKQGLDPVPEVEIPIAKDIADRVEGLIGPEGIGKIIRQYEKQNLSREKVAFKIAEDICQGKLIQGSKEQLAEQAIRSSLAVITESITAAPIEGIAKVKIKNNYDGSEYLAVYYAGPIRSAGGTAAGMSVLLADSIRKNLGLAKYEADQREVERYLEELELYNRVSHLQLPTTKEEQRFAAQNLTIEITGEPTDKVEVSGNRDLARIGTNRLRGGACLVFNDGLVGRSKKIYRRVLENQLEGWDWFQELIKIHEQAGHAINEDTIQDQLIDEEDLEVLSDEGYIKDVIAGRPVFAHPSEKGGFRIRYGRSRTTGLAGMGIHPALMGVVNDFLACGTHVRTERPGKGAIVMPVDTIHPPIVKLNNGDVLKVQTYEEAKEIRKNISEVLFLGDMLYGVGEFNQNSYDLIPAGYCEEWWSQQLEVQYMETNAKDKDLLTKDLNRRIQLFIKNPYLNIPTPDEAHALSKILNIPLHPEYTFHWSNIPVDDYIILRDFVAEKSSKTPEGLEIPFDDKIKGILEWIYIPHKVRENKIQFDIYGTPLLISLGIHNGKLQQIKNSNGKILDLINSLSKIEIRNKCQTYTGARMGRPEKAKDRRMKPPVHLLFPVEGAGERFRDLYKASENKTINLDLANRHCPKCGKFMNASLCVPCNEPTVFAYKCTYCKLKLDKDVCHECGRNASAAGQTDFPIGDRVKEAKRVIGGVLPKKVKAVKKLMNRHKVPELIEKGILRAKHGIFVYRDGTSRFDSTDAVLTHFKPNEVGVSIQQLHKNGYMTDVEGKPLENEDQLVELKIQDVVVNEAGGKHLLNVANFIDELLEKVYNLPPYYKAKKPEDLIGRIILGLAPHTSAGITGRIIGYTKAKVNFAHPYWHAAKRRNCLFKDEEILIWDTSTEQLIRKDIGKIVDELIALGAQQEVVDDYGTLAIENLHPHWEAVSIDETSNQAIFQPIKHWIKGRSKQWIEIRTKTGRTLKMTPNHNARIWNPSSRLTTTTKAKNLQIGDGIPVVKKPPIPIIQPPENINVLKELSSLPAEPKFIEFKHQVRLRGANSWMRAKIISFAQKKNMINPNKDYIKFPKQIKEYFLKLLPEKPVKQRLTSDWLKSIPLSHLEVLHDLKVFQWDEIPQETRLGMARDDHTVSPYIPFTTDLMRLLGYLIAEGYIRDEGTCYQINFSVPNPDLRKHVEPLIKTVLESTPYYKKDNHQLVHTGRIHAYLFAYAFGMRKKALDKRIPSFVYTLPEKYKFSFLSAIIDGDGSIITRSFRTTLYTGNYKLAQDYSLLLMSVGVFARLSKIQGGRYGDTVLERYEELGIEPKQNNPLYHVNIPGKENEILFNNIDLKHKKKKQNLALLKKQGYPQLKTFDEISNTIAVDKIKTITTINSNENSYCLEVESKKKDTETYHNIVMLNSLVTDQCDGDEDSIILALDAFLNFSRFYLPEIRGGKMDAPLILVANLNPHEVDDESHNVDTCSKYPLSFYEATLSRASPKSVLPMIDMISNRLDNQTAYEGFYYTHDTSSIFDGPESTAYKRLETMLDKVEAQLQVANIIRSVDVKDVANRIIVNHFIPDLIGNMRRFGAQKFRCTKCNRTYRRIPLNEVCPNCKMPNLNLTVHEKSVIKYLEMAENLVNKYELSEYLRNRLALIKHNAETLFEGGATPISKKTSSKKVEGMVKLSDFFVKADDTNDKQQSK